MPSRLHIDFVSDVSCPWCVIGLKGLEQALARVREEVEAEIHLQPFELNPHMGPEGQDIVEHITQKYGSTPEQIANNREGIRSRGAALGFTFNMDLRSRIYNTFDAHRLLHWAGLEGRQLELKERLFESYFTSGLDVSNRDVLVAAATAVGLDATRVREVLDTNAYADEIRQRERFYQRQGVNAVPSVIIDGKYLIQGGQPPEAFEQALRQIAASKASPSSQPASIG